MSWHKRSQKWYARIHYQGLEIYLGMFADKEKAARAYNEAAPKYHGEFATLNIIEGREHELRN